MVSRRSGWKRATRAWTWLWLGGGVLGGGLGLGLGSCSTVADDSTFRCAADADCPDGEVCLVNLGAVCAPAEQAPSLPDLGFEICEDVQGTNRCSFKTENNGCDQEVDTARDQLTIRRGHMGDEVDLRVVSISRNDTTAPPVPEAARVTAVQEVSRLARPLTTSAVNFVLPDEGEVTPVRLHWPYYHPLTVDEEWEASRAIVTEVVSTETEGRAPYYRMLLRRLTSVEPPICRSDADCGDQVCRPTFDSVDHCTSAPTAQDGASPYTFLISSSEECHRNVVGRAVTVDPDGITVNLSDVEVAWRYAETPEEPVLVPPLASPGQRIPCGPGGECAPGLACLEDQCVLDMAGRIAASTTTTDEEGRFNSVVYTYCDAGPINGREVTIEASRASDEDAAVPTIRYDFLQPFYEFSGGTTPEMNLPEGRTLCFPAWGEARTDIRVGLQGPATELYAGAGGSWTCCDTDCLPTAPGDVPPESPSGCNGTVGQDTGLQSPTLRFETSLFASEVAHWEDAGCLQPRIVDDVAGSLTVESQSCDSPETTEDVETWCKPQLTAGRGEDGRIYEMKIITPPNSVLASKVERSLIEVGINTPPIGPITLEPRPIIRGRVLLPQDRCNDAEAGCGAERVEVVAERLRVPGDDPDLVVGPFFYRTTTFTDPADGTTGHYVLPVNPGTYAVTALPSVGIVASPSPISVIDTTDGGAEADLQLTVGALVRLRLEDFDRSASIFPLDLGTWSDACEQAGFSDANCLNLPDTCYGTQGGEGCRIRAVVAEQRLLLSANGEVQYIARQAQSRKQCP